MRESTMRGLLVGAGYFAQFHADGWRRLPQAEIAAVVDTDAARARALAEQFGIPGIYATLEEALSGEAVDFVDIATRPESHLGLTRVAAARKLHVICQKPMAPTWDECVAMVEACEGAGVRLLIHENWRWQPWYREAQRILESGDLGRPFQISMRWRTGDGRGEAPYAAQPYFRQMPRLLVHETLVHLLDTLRLLAGDLASVYCVNRRVNPVIAGEDAALIVATTRSGIAGLIDANRISGPNPPPVAMNTLTVEGERGTLHVTDEGRIFVRMHGEAAREHAYEIPTEGYKGDSVCATQQHLLDCLRRGQASESEGRGYLKTVAAAFACYRSAETGQVVVL